MTKFFGFALADSMFSGDCAIQRKVLTADEVKAMAGELTPCLNPSHQATIDAMRKRYGIDVAIPEIPPRVSLGVGDSVVVMGVRGLPRLTDRHEYTEEEIAQALLAAGADDEVWLGLPAGVQVLADHLGRELFGEIFHGAAGCVVGGEDAPDRVDDLIASAVAAGEVNMHPGVVGGSALDLPEMRGEVG